MSKSTFTPSINHWRMRPGLFYETVTREQLRHVLLNSADPIIGGRLHRWKSKHLGAGVYKLWAEVEP